MTPASKSDEVADLRESQPPASKRTHMLRRQFFFFFLLSGFCSILYEVIWLRLAMAQFGVTTALISTVLSVFMAGLGAGSWSAGKLTRRTGARSISRLRAYALTEFLIGIGSLVVPYELFAGRKLLEAAGLSSSFGYYLAAGLWLTVTLIPWCACMGATFPVAMWALSHDDDRERSFSFLYLANMLGALGGAVLPLLLIEAWGFRIALRIGGVLNLMLALWAYVQSTRNYPQMERGVLPAAPVTGFDAVASRRLYLALLFATGLTSMGMEVVWIRLYTPYLGTEVYAFAGILGVYLGSTFLGSLFYRRNSRTAENHSAWLWAILGTAALLPLLTADPQIKLSMADNPLFRTMVGIVPFTALLGFLSPMLVDRVSGGDPDRAGSAYATNVIGCIVGPLMAGFILLPSVGERWSLTILASIWFVAGGFLAFEKSSLPTVGSPLSRRLTFMGSLVLSALLLTLTHDYESLFREKIVMRDSTATVIATGTGRDKLLLINGVGITSMTPITKLMAHLPLALLGRPPARALDICFGMGTTYRALLSWGIHVDAVELVPSVPVVLRYFHPDAPRLLESPLGHVFVDDGRRYLERTQETYDLITIDPPPPVPAAGSSLLYSKEFYAIAKRRLRPGGILAQWLPYGDPEVKSAFGRALQESFTHVRVFVSIEGWGVHMLASDSPIPNRNAQALAQRLPEDAKRDLLEWGPSATADSQFAAILRNEIRIENLISPAPSVAALSDDHPVNEYYLLRHLQNHEPVFDEDDEDAR